MNRLVFLMLLATFFGGCASKPAPATYTVSAGTYSEAFEAAKQTLRDYAFELDRVDARDGVITTAPRASSGAATPWVPHTDTLGGAMEGAIQFERRIARIEFRPAESVQVSDLRFYEGEMTAEVIVDVQRLYRPLRRVDPTGVRLTTFAVDPKLVESGHQPLHSAHAGHDERLAGRIAGGIARHSEPDNTTR